MVVFTSRAFLDTEATLRAMCILMRDVFQAKVAESCFKKRFWGPGGLVGGKCDCKDLQVVDLSPMMGEESTEKK